MPDATAIGSFIVAAVIGGVGLWWSNRKLRKAGVGDLAGGGATARDEAISNLQLLADTWEERYNLEHEAVVSAQLALAELRATQAIDRQLAAECRTDLDNARSEIRLLERRRTPRGPG